MSSASPIELLIPLPARVVLRRLEPVAAPSPYVIPDAAREKPTEAEVVAIPALPTYEYGILIPCPVSPGDKVLVGKYSGDVKFRNDDVTIIRWDEILAIISEPVDEPIIKLPVALSAADLDAFADEQRVQELTSHDTTTKRAVPRI